MEKELRDTAARKVTSKTTRAELLKAYGAALEKLEEVSSGKIPGRESDRQALEKALTYTDENVIKAVAELQVGIGKALKDLTERLIGESGKLADLRTANELESSKLKELHDIDHNSNTLAALIAAQSERTASFEAEMAKQSEAFESEILTRRDDWKREQQLHENDVKERDLTAKRQHERDEEEYKYKLSVERRKDAADYEARKVKLQQELDEERTKVVREFAERKAVLDAQEDELVELRKRVDRFPKELEEAVKKAETAIRCALKQQYDFDAKLAEKDVDAEKRVSALKIGNLEDLLAKQQGQITDLAKQLQSATKQVQEMAVKAIESSSGFKGRSAESDNATDQKKNN